MPPKDLDEYIWWLMDQKPELEKTPKEVKVELHKQLSERMEALVNAAIVAALPPSSLEEFEKVLDEQDQEAAIKFCESRIPNMDEVVARALLQFKEDYLGAV